MLIYVHTFKLTVLQRKDYIFIYLSNTKYVLFFKIQTKFVKLFILNDFFLELTFITNNVRYRVCDTLCNTLIKQFCTYNFLKIKFAGKGYKIKKISKNSFLFVFNRAHQTILFFKNNFFKKIKKRKIYIKYVGFSTKCELPQILKKIRCISPYTKRGLRLAKQTIYKRRGKRT